MSRALTKAQQEEREQSRAWLLKHLKPGTKVTCLLRHCSKSGMSRSIDLYTVIDGELTFVSYHARVLLGYSFDTNHGGIKMSGCGMDMGFAMVYNLSCTLYRDGFGIEGKHPMHTAAMRALTKDKAARMVRAGWEFYGRNGDATGWDNDGGYALKHEWL